MLYLVEQKQSQDMNKQTNKKKELVISKNWKMFGSRIYHDFSFPHKNDY